MLGEHFRGAVPPDQQNIVRLELAALLHARRAYGHAWSRQSDRIRPLGDETLDVGAGHMALDDISVDLGSVAGSELVADAGLSLQRSERAGIGVVHLHGKAVRLE